MRSKLIGFSSNELIPTLHDRMPAILLPDSYDDCLNPEASAEELRRSLKLLDPSAMEAAFAPGAASTGLRPALVPLLATAKQLIETADCPITGERLRELRPFNEPPAAVGTAVPCGRDACALYS